MKGWINMKQQNTFNQATIPWYGCIYEPDNSMTLHFQISLATPVIVNYDDYHHEVWKTRYVQNIDQKRSNIYEAFEGDYFIGESLTGVIEKKDILNFIVNYLRENDFKKTPLNHDFERWFTKGGD